MRKRHVKFLAAALACLLAVQTAGCGNNSSGSNSDTTPSNDSTNAGEEKTEGEEKYGEFLTVDVFANESNYEGIEKGWFAEVVKEKFNMELNIISPNVSGGGDTLFTTRSAAGDLGDIVIISTENGRLNSSAKANLLYDMTEWVENSEVLSQYDAAINKVKGLVDDGKVYGIPKQVSSQAATTPSETGDLGFGAYIRWDYYAEQGYPEINTLEDLIPIMKEMQEAHPTSDSGANAYAFSLFGDWDGNMMNLAQQPARFYGYNEVGFVLSKVDGSDYQSIIEDDSIYVRGLKFFYEANKEGLVDPESTTQNWDTMWNKYVDGAVYFSPWSWLGPSAYNTAERTAEGVGFKFAEIADTEIISAGAAPAGGTNVIAIGSKAEDPERMFDFIEWLYSTEGILANCTPDGGAAGPEGVTWEVVDGTSQLTELGKTIFADPSGATLPDDFYGGGSWRDGVSALNFPAVLHTDINPETGEPFSYQLWDSYIEENQSELDRQWSEHYGYSTVIELTEAKDEIIVEPGTDFVSGEETSELTALRNQCKEKIVDYSWRMIFSSSDEEFNSLLAEMQTTVKGLGYDEVLAFDMETAEQKDVARDKAREQ